MGTPVLIYHPARVTPADYPSAPNRLDAERSWRPATELFTAGATDAPTLVLADGSILEHVESLHSLPVHVIVAALDEGAATALGSRLDLSMTNARDPAMRAELLDAACRLAALQWTAADMTQKLARTDREFHELSRIGMALMCQHDRTALLDLIVDQGLQLLSSDGAGIVLLEPGPDGQLQLRTHKYAFASPVGRTTPEMRYAIDSTTIVGHAALTRQPVVVADVSRLPPDSPFTTSTEFQRRYRHRARSVLAVPMLDQQDGLLGVLVFINRKSEPDIIINTADDADRQVLPYTDREVRLARSLASQAAVSIENSRLYALIEQLFESFVMAAVSAVDERDPATAGHSLRVDAMTRALAEAVDRTDSGPYRDIRFTLPQMRELHFAALLHDFGKFAVPEEVLLKANKLPPVLWERVSSRFDLIHRTIELEYTDRRAELYRIGDRGPNEEQLQRELTEALEALERMRAIVRAANQPTVLDRAPAGALADIAQRTYQHIDGVMMPYLSPRELHYLQLARGTLDERERAAVEAHAVQTYRFLSQIPWTEGLKNLPTFAYGHHEMLDGSGYPQGLTADEIPVQTRMITLADIFDALTEADRPYKPAMSPERAFDIIGMEVRAGRLDGALVEIMIESRSYEARE